MPPKVSKPQPNLIREFLQQKKREAEEKEKDKVIEIPSVLREHIDIRLNDKASEPKFYSCNTFSHVWFREHSNLDEIVKSYWEAKEARKTKPIASYVSFVIRTVTSDTTRRLVEPFKRFHFQSARHEELGKILLRNPGIKSAEDFRLFLSFFNENRLRVCSVKMQDDVWKSGRVYVAQRQLKQNTTSLPLYTKEKINEFVCRQYYLRENLVDDVFLVDCTVEDIEKISNFKRVIEKMMEDQNVPTTSFSYMEYASLVLSEMQQDTHTFLAVKELKFHPKYNIVCNIIPEAVQNELASDIETFYNQTNAASQRKKHKSELTKEEFFENYKSCNAQQRKFFPYHQLCYDPPLNDSLPLAVPQEIQYETRVRFERNENPPPIETIDDVSEASIDTILKQPHVSSSPAPAPSTPKTPPTVVRKPSTAPQTSVAAELPPAVVETRHIQFEIPARYFVEINLEAQPAEKFALLEILCGDTKFISAVKRWMRSIYAFNFDATWKNHKKFIVFNLILELFNENVAQLISLLESCPPSVVSVARTIIDRRTNELKQTDFTRADQNQSSSVTNNQLPQEASSNLNTLNTLTSVEVADKPAERSIEEQIMILEKGEFPLPETVLVIKKEKETDRVGPSSDELQCSDVICMGSVADKTICISDSEDADESLRKLLEQDESQNPFLREINEGTQDVGNEVVIDGRSNDTLQQLQEFEPLSVRHVLQDKLLKLQAEAVKEQPDTASPKSLKRKRKGRPPGPKSKTKVFSAGGLEYIDDDSPSPGKLSADGTNSHADLNIFLSSQLDTDVQPFELFPDLNDSFNTFTFVKSVTESETPVDPACFVVEITRVYFEKNVSFEMHLNLQQYTIYNHIVRDGCIKELLNIGDVEFTSVMNLLEVLGKYEYIPNRIRFQNSLGSSGSDFITLQLDLFFSTQIKFKTFHLNVNGDKFACVYQRTNSNSDITTGVDAETLVAMRNIK